MTFENYELEILNYIDRANGKKVYISELAENLLIDFDIIEEIYDRLEL